jgi:tRNA pseudouridine38-40 synthase
MRNLKLEVEYDGTDFHGFQRQAALRTVQGVLEDRFSRLLREPIAVIGAGRTDAGVHALGQVVNFRTTRPVPVETVVAVLNRALPEDVKVQRAEEVAESFHARRAACSRTYRYTLLERDTPSPRLGRFALVTAERLDVARMTKAARGLLGRHDFRAFQASGSAAKSTARTLYRLECQRHGNRVEITVEADAFLYRMVRLLVSALRAVSRGEVTAEALQDRLRSGDRSGLTATAPACGLCLLQVSYTAAGRTKSEDYCRAPRARCASRLRVRTG